MYGVWSLVSGLTGYLGLAELGIRRSVGRYITYHIGRKETEKVNRIISASMAIFVGCGLIVFVAALSIAFFMEDLFTKIPLDMMLHAKLCVLVIALNLWLSFFNAPFNEVLVAHDHFDLVNAINIAVLMIRTAGTVFVLYKGYGMLGLAVTCLFTSVIGITSTNLIARRVFGELRISLSLISKNFVKELFGFGIWAFVSNIAMHLLYYTDTILIAILLGPEMVTFYSIPLMLVLYGKDIVDQISRIIAPQTIRAIAVGDHKELRNLFLWSTKALMFVAIPLFIGLIVFGKEFIVLWMGEEFGAHSHILILLAIPQLVVMAVSPGGSIIAGLGYVRFGALMTLTQGIVNLGLTLLFVMVMKLGLTGVALGTLVPMVVANVILALFILRWIKLSVNHFLLNNVVRWVITIFLFGALSYFVSLLPWHGKWCYLILKVAIVICVFIPMGYYILFSKEEKKILFQHWAGLFSRTRKVII